MQTRPIILRSLLIVATPYAHILKTHYHTIQTHTHGHVFCHVYGGVFWSENCHVCHKDTLYILDTHSPPYLVGWCVSQTHTVFKTRCHTIQTPTHRHTFSTQQTNTAIILLTDKDTLPTSSGKDSLLYRYIILVWKIP